MGILITFSGIDGAGKSTQVKLLEEYLKKTKKKVYVTEKMFGYYLLKPFIGLLRKSTGSPKGGPVTRNKYILPKLWFIPAFIDIWISYFFRTKSLLKKYDIVIADRYYTDIWANLLYYGYLPSWAYKVCLKLLPKPNIALMMMVEPKNVLKREREFPPSYYKEQEIIYKNLALEVGCNIIDSNRDINSIFQDIRATVSKVGN